MWVFFLEWDPGSWKDGVDHLGTVRKPGDPIPRAHIAAVSSWDPLRLPDCVGDGGEHVMDTVCVFEN